MDNMIMDPHQSNFDSFRNQVLKNTSKCKKMDSQELKQTINDGRSSNDPLSGRLKITRLLKNIIKVLNFYNIPKSI